MQLYDTHCHLQDERLAPDLESVMQRAATCGVLRLRCCACEEADWPTVAHLAIRYPAVRPAYGLHPWYLDRRTPGWEALLRARLNAEPSAIVGEIGLDHAIDSPDHPLQAEILKTQLRVAADLGRPVSLHCRKAWGSLLALLRSLPRLPPALIFHAYSGDAELIPLLVDLNGWFSFCGSLTREGNRRGRASATRVPDDRVLLESDAPDLSPRQAPADRPNEPAHLVHTLAELALCRNQPVERVAELTWQNACRVFKDPDSADLLR
jgi:TatD DNase family protein